MSWQDDPDTEGVVEENPFRYIIIGGIGLLIVTLLYVGIPYKPEWFEGQNLVSTIGIIFLLIFVPAIAISTLTGKSDLVKWEAIFLFLSVFMILLGNGFDFSKFMPAFSSNISALGNTKVSQVLMALIILIGIGIAFAAGSGHKVSGGAILAILVLLAVIGIINLYNSGYFNNLSQNLQQHGFWYMFGKALSDFTGGLAAGKAGMAIGFGCLVIGFILVIFPNFSTPIGILLLIIGTGITGYSLWETFKPAMQHFMEELQGKHGKAKQATDWLVILGGGGGISGLGLFLRSRLGK